MIAVYQLLHGKLDLNPHIFFDTAVAKPRAITRIRGNAFSVSVVNDWNSLPPAVVNADTLNQFKNSLDSHWAHIVHTIPHADG